MSQTKRTVLLFVQERTKEGTRVGRIPAFPMGHRLLYLCVGLWSVATVNDLTPGSRPHHIEQLGHWLLHLQQ